MGAFQIFLQQGAAAGSPGLPGALPFASRYSTLRWKAMSWARPAAGSGKRERPAGANREEIGKGARELAYSSAVPAWSRNS